MKIKRNLSYMQKTIEELIEMYADENNRVNKEDAIQTKKLIVNEIYSRVKRTFDVLDFNEDVNVKSLYQEFIQPAEKIE